MSKYSWRGTWQGIAPDGDTHQRSRTIVRPTGGIVRGKFPSRKNGRMVHHEGLLELDAIYLFEISPAIAGYREQAATIHYPDGVRLRRYTPDFELTLVTGETILVEVKPRSSMAHQEIKHKLQCVGQHLHRSSQRFVILDDDVLRKEPRQANVRAIYHRAKRVPPTRSECQISLERTCQHFPLPLALAEILMAGDIDPFSLLLAGLLRCDLNQPITQETVLTTTDEDDDAWFYLAQEYGF